jgi:hypothetical protein
MTRGSRSPGPLHPVNSRVEALPACFVLTTRNAAAAAGVGLLRGASASTPHAAPVPLTDALLQRAGAITCLLVLTVRNAAAAAGVGFSGSVQRTVLSRFAIWSESTYLLFITGNGQRASVAERG